MKVGEAVYGLTDPSSVTRDGAEADFIITTDSEIAPKPRTLAHEHAAGVPMAGLTAWQALFDHAHLTSKDTILIHGAAGGVGSIAVQLAKWAGAHVIGTASTHNCCKSNIIRPHVVQGMVRKIILWCKNFCAIYHSNVSAIAGYVEARRS
jgi:NADPH:quinone reductase-like Zn-dependent oxidoreductase